MSLQRKVATKDGVRKGVRSRQHKPATSRSNAKKAQQSLETRDRLLDAAEELFANFGLYGVTVRNVSEHVGVDSALIPYYFGTKRGMFDAVFARRADTINAARMAAMDAYEATVGNDVTVEGAIVAFLSPILENDRHEDAGWRNFSALVALANNSKEWGGEMMSRYSVLMMWTLFRSDWSITRLPGFEQYVRDLRDAIAGKNEPTSLEPLDAMGAVPPIAD